MLEAWRGSTCGVGVGWSGSWGVNPKGDVARRGAGVWGSWASKAGVVGRGGSWVSTVGIRCECLPECVPVCGGRQGA